jgi:hypothetical protein
MKASTREPFAAFEVSPNQDVLAAVSALEIKSLVESLITEDIKPSATMFGVHPI